MKKELLFTATAAIALLLAGCNANTKAETTAPGESEITTETVDSATPSASDQAESPVLEAAEIMPEFPGGTKALLDSIAKNLKYPPKAINSRTEGRVILQFVIDKQGKVTDVQVMRGVTPDLDQAAIDVMRSLPDWKPGMQDGKPVNVKYTMPIVFKLQ